MSKTRDQRIDEWLDRNEIRACIERYPRGLDRHDDDILRSVFHADAFDQHGTWKGNRDDFVQWANHECHNAYNSHQHHITTHNCEIEGDVAHTESYVIFMLPENGKTTVRVGGGRYLDRLEKRDGEWRVVRRKLITDFRFMADASAFNTPLGNERGTWDRSDPSYQRPLTIAGFD